MAKPLTIKDFLPKTPMPIGYMTYRSDAYTAKNGFIYATEKDAIIRDSDEFGIFLREDCRYNLPEGSIDFFGASPDTLRSIHFQKTHGRKKEPVKLKNGIELITDLIDGLHAGARQDETGAYALNPEEMTSAVKSLCEKYGLLAWQDETISELTPDEIRHQEIFTADLDYIPKMLFTNEHDSVRQYSIYFCTDVRSASSSIIRLYNLYLIWKVLFWNATNQEKKTLDRSLLVSRFMYCLDIGKNEVNLEDYNMFVCIESLRNEVKNSISFKKGNPIITPLYKNALEAAIGCMLSIIARGRDGLEERTIASCERCGANYIKYHGRQKYCETCADNTIQVREYRARKKAEREAQKNAQESEQ